jgi:uncharacterized membrane protein (DUF106 family)
MDLILLMQQYPKESIILTAILLSFVTLMITKFVTDQKKMKELRDKQKELRKKSKEFSKDVKKMMEINKEMMEMSMEMMKHSFKPLLLTFIPLLVFFWWLRTTFEAVLPGWIWYYIIASIISSLILRKLLDVA